MNQRKHTVAFRCFAAGLLCAAVAVTCSAAVLPAPLPVRLRLKTGRTISCTVYALKKKELTVRRTLDSGTILTEFYCTDDIAILEFPVPRFLSAAATQDVSTVRALNRAVNDAEKEYRKWRQFEKLPGNWAAPVGYIYAQLLEKKKRYSAALPVYKRIGKQHWCNDTRRKSILRSAVCSYYCGQISNAYVLCTNALDLAVRDDERAEAGYYCGVILTEFGRPVESLFMLLKNTVFYHMQDAWEARSLVAALRNYALLNDRARIEITCDTIMAQYPGTQYSRCAVRCRDMCKAQSALNEIYAVIQLCLEKYI